MARRRAAAAAARDERELLAAGLARDPLEAVRRVVGEREREEFGAGDGEGRRVRPLEDAGLVGEEAAGRARRERERREGVEALVVEDRRWDWLLGMCMCFLPWGVGRGLMGGDVGRRGDMLTRCSANERLGCEGEELEEVP